LLTKEKNMGFFEELGKMIDKAFEAVIDVAVGIGKAVKEICTAILVAVPHPVIKAVAGVILAVAKFFEALKPDENLRDLGDRAMQAAASGIRLDDFPSWDDYYNAIRNFPLDPEKSAQFDDDKLSLLGTSLATVGIAMKLGMTVDQGARLPILIGKNPDFFQPQRIEGILSETKDIGSIADYFDGKLGRADDRAVESFLVSVEKKLNPDKTDGEIRAMLRSVAKDESKSDG
jgi:hypothetical protein